MNPKLRMSKLNGDIIHLFSHLSLFYLNDSSLKVNIRLNLNIKKVKVNRILC